MINLYVSPGVRMGTVVKATMREFSLKYKEAYPLVSVLLKERGLMRHGHGRRFSKGFCWKRKLCDSCCDEFEPTGRSQRFCSKCTGKDGHHVLITYGLTSEDYDAIFTSQAGLCAICSCDLAQIDKKNVHVDHDHITGHVRGLLCGKCNWRLGAIDHASSWLQSAHAYLGRQTIAPRCDCVITRKILQLNSQNCERTTTTVVN